LKALNKKFGKLLFAKIFLLPYRFIRLRYSQKSLRYVPSLKFIKTRNQDIVITTLSNKALKNALYFLGTENIRFSCVLTKLPKNKTKDLLLSTFFITLS